MKNLQSFVSPLFLLAFAVPLTAATYQWDPNGSDPGLGGAATWNAAPPQWDLVGTGADDGTDATVVYTNLSADTFNFGGTAGTVLISNATITLAGSFNFDIAGYTIQNGANNDTTFTDPVTVGGAGLTTFSASGGGFGDFKFNGGLTINSGATARVGVRANGGNAISSMASIAGDGDLELYGSNIHQIFGNNTGFSGSVSIAMNGAANPVQIQEDGALGSGDVTLTKGQLDLNGNTLPNNIVLNNDDSNIAILGEGGTLSGIISEAGGSRSLTAATSLTLSNVNTYTGDTVVTGTTTLSLGDGTNSTGLDDASTVSLAADSVLDLNFSGTDTVDKLIIDGITQPTGTWGSSTSGATNVDDTHFSGTGTLTVLSTIDPLLDVTTPVSFTNDGSSTAYSIPVSNIGATQTLSITNVTVSGADASTVSGLTTSLSIPALGSDNIDFTFTPDLGSGTYTFDFTIDSNTPGNPSQLVEVSIEVQDPLISVPTTLLNFGVVSNTAGPQILTFEVFNNGGSEDLTISDTPVTGATEFAVTSAPATIAPGDSDTVEVTFTPGAASGRLSATLSVTSDDYLNSTPEIRLEAFLDPSGSVVGRFDFDPNEDSGTTVDLDGSDQTAWATGDLIDEATGTGALGGSNQDTANRNLISGLDGDYLRFGSNRESDAQTPIASGGNDESTWTTFTVTPDSGGGAIDFNGGTAVIDTYANHSTGLGGTVTADWTLYYSTDGGSSWTSLGTFAGAGTTGPGQVVGPVGLSWDLSSLGNQTAPVDFILDPVSTGSTNGSDGQRGVGFDNLVLTAGSVTPGSASFASWASGFGIPNDPDHDATDNDGISALIEYALGLSPLVAEGSPGTLTGGLLSFSKGAEAVANNDITYAIEESDDLGVGDPWETVTPDVNDASTISYTLPTGQPSIFARLVVTQNP